MSFYFMAAVTICSDFRVPPKKSVTVSTVSPSICHIIYILQISYICICISKAYIYNTLIEIMQMWHSHKEFACQYRRHNRCRFYHWVRKIPWNRKRQPSPVFLTGKCHGKGIWWATIHGITELDMTEQVTEHTCTQANIHRHIDTHTHTDIHTHIHIYIYIYFFFFFPGKNTEMG